MNPDPLPVSESLRVYNDLSQAIGNTPLIRLSRLDRDLPCPLYAKVEFFNPGGSVKDRIGINIIEEAEKSGRLIPGGTVVEATSGNTGVGLAIICALRGYKAVFVMPDKMSQEKIQLLRAFGARVVITPTAVEPDDPRSYYKVAERIVKDTPNSILANQYHNPENPRSHYLTTGPEIWNQTNGKVTAVVIGMGTGGTISGVGKYLKEKNPEIRIIGVDPVGSILLEIWEAGSVPDDAMAETYKVEGIGEDFLPSTLDLSVIDEVIRISDKESFLWARRLVRREGIFAGGSTGTAVAAAVKFARFLTPDDLVVVIIPDTGSRYLSKFYDDKWMRENGFMEAVWSEVTLHELLYAKGKMELISANSSDNVINVIGLMKTHDISQVPVINQDGTLAGMVTEVSLLKYMIEGEHEHPAEESIDPLVQKVQSFPGYTILEEVISEIVDGNVIMVTEANRPIGILTKIDVLDYIAQEV